MLIVLLSKSHLRDVVDFGNDGYVVQGILFTVYQDCEVAQQSL